MTERRRNGSDIGTGKVQRLPPPALGYEDRTLALLWLASAVTRNDDLRALVGRVNHDMGSVPVAVLDGVLAYAMRCCPQLRSAATCRAIDQERQALRESWALADQLDEWRNES